MVLSYHDCYVVHSRFVIGPWLGCCIGFYNYKFFVMFLAWTLLLCLFVVLEIIPLLPLIFAKYHSAVCYTLIYYPSVSRVFIVSFTLLYQAIAPLMHLFFLGFFAITFFISVLFLLGSHLLFIRVNATTLESGAVVCYSYPHAHSSKH